LGLEADGSGTNGGGCGAGAWRSKHTIYAWKAKSGGLAVKKGSGWGSSRMELTG